MAINDISLTAGMRSNLVSLQSTVALMNRTQERLATGKNVNTALDNPLNYFTAQSLNSRAVDLAAFKDGMSEAIQTIKTANTGTTAITGLIAQAKAIAATAKATATGGGTLEYVNLDLASVTAGQTVTIGNTTFSAVQTSIDSITLALATVTAGQTISIAGVTYTASAGAAGTGAGTTAFDITNNDTAAASLALAVGSVTNVAAASTVTYNSATLTFTGVMTAGTTISIGGRTFTSSAGAGGTGAGTLSFDNTTTTTAATSLAAAIGGSAGPTSVTATNAVAGIVVIVGATGFTMASGTVGAFAGGGASAGAVTKSITGTVTLTGGSTTNIKYDSVVEALGTVTTTINAADPVGSNLYANEFLIGADDAATATNLAAKANGAGSGGLSIAVGTGTYTSRLIATAGTTTLSTSSIVSAVTSMTETEVTGTASRLTYATQFNDLMKQLDKAGWDSGYKGTNLLGGTDQTLDVSFGTDAADKLTITGYDASSVALMGTSNTQTNDYGPATSAAAQNNWAANADIDADLVKMNAALTTLKAQSSNLASNLSVINVRQDWTTNMVNTLNTGSDNLTIADMNEEGANMLMLQTRQTLATTALSLSAQAAQSVLRLFA